MTWVLAPACSATAVREPLVETGNPWKRPAAILAAPMPIISRFPSTSVPLRAANAEAVEIVSASETTAIPTAPRASTERSLALTSGMVSGGKPDGRLPTTLTSCSTSENTVTAAIDTTTAIRTPGAFGANLRRPRISASDTRPSASAAPTVSPSATPSTNPRTSSMKPLASTLNPKSFGSWPTRMVSANPFMYPICVGLDSRSATKPSRSTAASTTIAPVIRASIEASATARSGSPWAATSGSSVAAIIGPSDESGPSTRIGDGPNSAYPARQSTDV